MSHTEVGERTWIDERADQFERDWRHGGERPRIEEYLADEPAPRRTRLLQELVRVEREVRQRAGETPKPEEYRKRFADEQAAFDAAFDIGDHPETPANPPPVSAGSPTSERRQLAQAHIERTLELLGQSHSSGEFRSGAIRLDELRSEPLLDPLRSDPRFQLLVMDLTLPEDPFRP
jgi:hypothetical protein